VTGNQGLDVKMYVVKSQGWLSKSCWLALPRSKSGPVTVLLCLEQDT